MFFRVGMAPFRCGRDGQVCVAAAYIARNPVTAGLCAEPEAVARGAALALLVAERTPSWIDDRRLLSFFAPSPEIARRRYAEMSR